MDTYRPRLIDETIRELMLGLPAVMVVGPRATGKTTTARRHAKTVVRLDRPFEAGPFNDDPDTVLASLDEPVLLDEWQMVPEVLPAIKRAVDDGDGVGRFLLTGSVRAELLAASWAATGRVVRLTQWGLSQRELFGNVDAPSFFDRVFADGPSSLSPAPGEHTLRTYVEAALRGGFPELALQESPTVRWCCLRLAPGTAVCDGADSGMAFQSTQPPHKKPKTLCDRACTFGTTATSRW
jgi:uncharacterized protein